MKKLLYILMAALAIFSMAVALIVTNKIKKNREASEFFRKEAAVYLLKQLTEDEETGEKLSALYNPLKNDTGIRAGELKEAFGLLGISWTDTEIFDLESKRDSYRLTPAEFLAVYDMLISMRREAGVIRSTYYVISEQEEGLHTNEGNLPCSFLEDVDIPVEVADFYVKDGTLVYYIGSSAGEATLHNVWLMGYEEGQAKIFMEDTAFQFPCNVTDENQKKTDSLADVVVTNTGLKDIFLKSEMITGKVLGVTDSGLRIEKYGELKKSPYYKIYKIKGDLMEEHTSNILMGYETVSYVVADGVVEAALLTEDIKTTNIRVVLNNSDYSSVLQSLVKLTCNTDFTMTYGEETRTFHAGEQVTLNIDSTWFRYNNPDHVIRFVPEEESGRIQMMSIERSQGFPSYRGVIEVALIGDNLSVVNELPIEEYLYSVIPSEMPVSYPMEALRAQAICARGYAYRAVMAGTYAAFGAHLDDSTNSQVYNNTSETEESIFAVKDTYGMVAFYGEIPMNTLFFSTSCGAFCNDGDVWGGEPSPYLKDHMDTKSLDAVDLSEENAFIQFMQTNSGMELIEQNEPYYRWNITFSAQELSDAINGNLPGRIAKAPSQILVKNDKGEYVKSEIESIGTVKDIKVTERGKSGIIKTMIITGDQGEIKVMGQTNIRNLITPKNVVIVRQDGSEVKNFTSLPSPYFYVEISNGTFILHGGGFGHGVGMSQNGAKNLANDGYHGEQIVEHYYSGAKLVNIYEEIKPELEATSEN